MSARLKGYLYVSAQFALIALIVVTPAGNLPWRGNPWTELVGQIAVLGGLGVVVWAGVRLGRSLTAHPMPNARASLTVDGPYRWARHPIYAGLLAFAFGAVSASASPIQLVAAVMLAVVLARKARFEEALLVERFGSDYVAYAKTVGRFTPWFGRY